MAAPRLEDPLALGCERFNDHPPRVLLLLGTWALTVYLLHQPIMMGTLALAHRLG